MPLAEVAVPVDIVSRRLLTSLVAAKLNVVIAGRTGAGKTTLLDEVGRNLRHDEHVIVVEETGELFHFPEGTVYLEARPPNLEGRGAIDVRTLLIAVLQMRPDRIVVGQVKDKEAWELLLAATTGHEGVLSTVHANSAVDAFTRLVLLARTPSGLPVEVVRRQIAEAIDVAVHMRPTTDGRRIIDQLVVTVERGERPRVATIAEIDEGGAPRHYRLPEQLAKRLARANVSVPADFGPGAPLAVEQEW